jgi:hypothetical protein
MIVGQVRENGNELFGAGYTSSKENFTNGVYTVTFLIPFAARPVVIATAEGDDESISVRDLSRSSFTVRIVDVSNHGGRDSVFSFIATGSK